MPESKAASSSRNGTEAINITANKSWMNQHPLPNLVLRFYILLS